MKIEEVISLVMTELNRAEEAHPDWPQDDVKNREIGVLYLFSVGAMICCKCLWFFG